ncbi:MAG TPA: O-antigen ligase family protein [Acidimicrobiales bacterium]|nr:O-antigen ligase family protein [Acidimicrobiales bacterium]
MQLGALVGTEKVRVSTRGWAHARERATPVGVLGVAAGLTLTAVLRRGAFFFPDSIVVVGGLGVVALVVARRTEARDRRIVVAAAAFCVWWLALAYPWPVPHRVVLLPAAVCGFAAAWIIGRSLNRDQRAFAVRAVLVMGIGLAVVDLGAVALRAYPTAMPHGGLWRAAGPFTYANAAGLLFAMVLPVALGTKTVPLQLQRLAAFAAAAGLVATMSRGAFVGSIGALLVVRAWRSPAVLAGIVGAGVGLAAAASSGTGSHQPVLLVLVAAGAVAAVTLPVPRGRWVRVFVALGAGGATLVLLLGSHAPLEGRADPRSVTDRWQEWTAAAHQFTAHPVAGSGPEKLLAPADGTSITYFAHNEYLQVAAGGGVVALVLLTGFGAAVAAAIRRRHWHRWSVAVLVAVGVAGAFDFTWHLPAIAILAGWLAALGTRDQ